VLLVLGILLSFLSVPSVSPSTLSGNFRWRADLIRLFDTARMKAGDRLFNEAVLADNGWIMFLDGQSIAEYQHTNRMPGEQLASLGTALSGLQESLAAQGRTLLVVIPPDKNTIYGPQHMPPQIPVLQGDSRLDQFEKYMRQHSTVQVLDLRGPLAEASKTQDVYYHTDTHWNDAGAYVGYVQILRALSAKYPVLQPHPLSDFQSHRVVELRDMPPRMGLPQLQEGSWYLMPKFQVNGTQKWVTLPENPGQALGMASVADPSLPSLLLFHDSFYGGLINFMAPHFSRITSVSYSTDPNIWTIDWVRVVPSDIVVIELTERGIDFMLPLLAPPAP
jgi:alginate O-acetyltransferase complex protein AlgJ